MKALLLIAVLLGPVLQPLQLQTGVVTGQILTKEGQPAAGIRVTAMVVPDSNVPASSSSTLVSVVLTDRAGRYRLESIPPGRYYVTSGLVELPTYYPGVASSREAKVVSVTAGATVTGIDFPMAVPAGFTVSGHVTRPPSQTARLTTVSLLGGLNQIAPANINADGSFQFQKILPGSYSLRVSSSAPIQSTNVVVTDQDISGIEIVVPVMVRVSGSVVVENDGLRPRLSLSFVSYKGGVQAFNASPTANGTFTIQVAEGEYRTSWTGLPSGYFIKSINAGKVDLLSNPLVVTENSAPSITVLLGVDSPVPWVKVTGRVTGALPQTGPATLTIFDATGNLNATINPDGSFEFSRILPGTYTARLIPALPIPPKTIIVGNKDLSGIEIMIPAIKEITGHVVIEGPRQIPPRLTFTVTDSSGNFPASAAAQPDGTFKLQLPEGEHRVALNVGGYTVKSLSYGGQDLLRNPLLTIPGKDSPEFQVTLAASALTVSGGVIGGVIGNSGVVGGVVSGVNLGVPGGVVGPPAPPTVVNTIIVPSLAGGAPPPPPPPTAPPASSAERIGGNVAQSNLIYAPTPAYPPAARAARVSGVVVLSAFISTEGNVESLNVVSGNEMLNDAAIAAVRQWRYKPFVVNGKPVRVQTTVTVNFLLQ